MAAIDDFKANLIGGGARANQFRVTITPPPGIAIGLDVRRASFLVTASRLPESTLGEIAVPFRGRNIYVTGDRPAPETWTTTFFNDTSLDPVQPAPANPDSQKPRVHEFKVRFGYKF